MDSVVTADQSSQRARFTCRRLYSHVCGSGRARPGVARYAPRPTNGLMPSPPGRALTNLIDNAIKYRGYGVPPQVDIAGAIVEGRYDLRVTDNGLGMSKEESDRAFEPFYRSPRVQDRSGTGLGPSIVRRVVETAGGVFAVELHLR
jgi:signal transduction histidine kinase